MVVHRNVVLAWSLSFFVSLGQTHLLIHSVCFQSIKIQGEQYYLCFALITWFCANTLNYPSVKYKTFLAYINLLGSRKEAIYNGVSDKAINLNLVVLSCFCLEINKPV